MLLLEGISVPLTQPAQEMFAILQDYEAPDEVVQIIAQHAYRRGAGTVSQGKLIRESAGIMGIIDITPVQRTET
jgi:hypothetical protein